MYSCNSTSYMQLYTMSRPQYTIELLVAKRERHSPEEQTLLMVVQGVAMGRPAPRAACLAGAWP